MSNMGDVIAETQVVTEERSKIFLTWRIYLCSNSNSNLVGEGEVQGSVAQERGQ